MRRPGCLFLIISAFLLAPLGMTGQGRPIATPVFHTKVPDQLLNIILSRPTDHSITLNLLSADTLDVQVKVGESQDLLSDIRGPFRLIKGIPSNILLDDLRSDQQYYYRVIPVKGRSNFSGTDLLSFHTQRGRDKGFSFAIQADSHLDENSDTLYYIKTLQNISASRPDFLIDLGDTWMTDKYGQDYERAAEQYLAQRYFLGKAASSAALFLTLGNHDGEYKRGGGRTGSTSMMDWASSMRKKYYSNPVPDGFYSGNEEGDGNYYAWEWGNALFIVLDPFRYTVQNRDPWQRTLGKTQYDWLENTLRRSDRVFKFVFIHNLVGGLDNKGIARGGAEASRFFEWGGLNADSSAGFVSHRSDRALPIHDLLLKYKVNIVFHGHDHFFARQERDGIIYQLVPQPGSTRYGNINSATEYGYHSGDIRNAPAYLKVAMTKDQATIEMVQASLRPADNGKVIFSYNIKSPVK